MDKYLAVSVSTLKRALKKGDCENLCELILKFAKPVPLEVLPYTTKQELAQDKDFDFAWDYALPQHFWDDFHSKLGINPLPHFVWDIRAYRPVPLTQTAEVLLEVYRYVTNHES